MHPPADAGSQRAGGLPLESFADLTGDCAITYERAATYDARNVVAKRLQLLLPRNASTIEIEVGEPKTTYRVDSTTALVVPSGQAIRIQSASSVVELITIEPTQELLERSTLHYALPPAAAGRYFATPQFFIRTTWFDELQHRYVFERLIARQNGNVATTFLEMELVKEAYYIGSRGLTRGAVHCVDLVHLSVGDSLTQRALAFMEAHLFEPLSLQEIADGVKASRSSLVRAFRKNVGTSPLGYIRERRLEEATLLIKSGRYAVGHVARIVGYENFSAFSQAFKRKYLTLPSEWRAASPAPIDE